MKFISVSTLMTLLLVNIAFAETSKLSPESGALSGRVVVKENANKFSGAIVSIFNANSGPLPDAAAIRRVPEGLIKTRKNGEFRVVLPEGKFYLGVMFRSDHRVKGPPGPGEKFFFPRDEKGKMRLFKVTAGQDNNVGSLDGTEPAKVPEIPNALVVEGTVVNEQGKPFSGALIIVRRSMKIPRPVFISPRTGPDGKYRLTLPPGGPYYLVARENLVNVGRPTPGEFVGTYGGGKPENFGQATSVFADGKPVGGAANETLTGMNITMYKIPDPEEVKRELLKQSEEMILPGGGKRQQFPLNKRAKDSRPGK